MSPPNLSHYCTVEINRTITLIDASTCPVDHQMLCFPPPQKGEEHCLLQQRAELSIVHHLRNPALMLRPPKESKFAVSPFFCIEAKNKAIASCLPHHLEENRHQSHRLPASTEVQQKLYICSQYISKSVCHVNMSTPNLSTQS